MLSGDVVTRDYASLCTFSPAVVWLTGIISSVLRVVDGVRLSAWDWAGALIALCGMLIIVTGWGKA
ncbi:hypothetical protein [Pantoea sp. M_9]|uniref:hypothetical protein n=1 Tax=Pantoea sp. M_9 TaxID=2608041 RepID=UPI00351B785C